MNIVRRTTDILSAHLNDLIDRFEQPEKMLRQGLREMETSLDTASAAVARSIAVERLLQKERDEHEQRVAAWGQRAAAAVQAGDDVLARRALTLKHEHAAHICELDGQLTTARATNATLRSQIDLLRHKYLEARRTLSLLSARQAAASAQMQLQTGVAGLSQHFAAANRFRRHFQKLELAEAEAMALAELDAGADESLVALEFERQVTRANIEAELAALKQQNA